MYCSSCGSVAPPALSFCNRCGAELRTKEPPESRPGSLSPDLLVRAIFALTSFGLVAIIGLILVMKIAHFELGLIIGFSFFTFLLILLFDLFFAFLILRSKKEQKTGPDLAALRESIQRELQAASPNEPMLSITDHTTRTLDPVPRDRQTSEVKSS